MCKEFFVLTSFVEAKPTLRVGARRVGAMRVGAVVSIGSPWYLVVSRGSTWFPMISRDFLCFPAGW